MFLNRLLLASTVGLLTHFVQGSIYATQPVSDTVFRAGRSLMVSWIDIGSPSVSEMGPMKIELFVDNKYVANLANDVNPRKLSHNVTISPQLGPNRSDYHLRFIFKSPPTTIYSADFTLTGMTGDFDDTAPGSNSSRASKISHPGTSISYTSITLVLPSTTITSLIPNSAASQGATASPTAFQTSQRNAAAGSGRRFQVEKIQFRLVFVLWPALIGVALAL